MTTALREVFMTRRRILIVEDEYLIAENCASCAEEAGFEVAGPYSKLGDVPQELSGISGAILDLNLCGVSAYPLIDRLLEMNIPVTLYTGYDARYCPTKYAKLSRVTKPTPCIDAIKDLMRQLPH
jgi:CheY-like chemotaxis protein